MKDQDIILKVQAFMDGQLPEAERAQVAALIARDSDVSALVKELKQTRQALAGFDESVELPESREFFWSKVEREIERIPREEPAPVRRSLSSVLLRWFVPATCVAGLVALGFLFAQNLWSVADELAWQSAHDEVDAFTYHDYEEGVSVLWLSYPSDNTVANSGEAATIN